MAGTSMLLTIIRRENEPHYEALLARENVHRVLSVPCEGTAGPGLLSLLGLEQSEKTLLLAMMSRAKAAHVMRRMVIDLGLNLPGYGIAMSVPAGSVGGQSSLKYFMGNQTDETNSEVDNMPEHREFPYDLVIAVASTGSAEQVMSAAKTAGAGGGTVLHAKGIGSAYAEKFLGFALGSEKEMLLIVARHEQKDAIMHAIMEQTGMKTDTHAVVFSLPVEDVAGLRSVMKEDNE